MSSASRGIVRKVPVLKMPPELALPALRILAETKSPEDRRSLLVALRPEVPPRNLLNAYVLPSLNELRIFDGTLRTGRVTEFGRAVANASESEANLLMAKQLVGLDGENVGLIDWMLENVKTRTRRRSILGNFADDRIGSSDPERTAYLDRLSKWTAYLVHFGLIREHSPRRGSAAWTISRRHIAGLRSTTHASSAPPDPRESEAAILAAYANASRQLGTRLYIPVALLRDELGKQLGGTARHLTDFELDELLRALPVLLPNHTVTFSPFSGPARGGLKLDNMYAGFVSVRAKTLTSRPGDAKQGRTR